MLRNCKYYELSGSASFSNSGSPAYFRWGYATSTSKFGTYSRQTGYDTAERGLQNGRYGGDFHYTYSHATKLYLILLIYVSGDDDTSPKFITVHARELLS